MSGGPRPNDDDDEDAMKSRRNLSIALICLVVVSVAGATVSIGRSEKPPLNAAVSLDALLERLPPGSGSAADSAVARWAARVQQQPRDDSAWAQLGDALMQKARETMDPGYYGRAETAFGRSLALNPQSVTAMAGLSWVHGARHEFEESIAWANRALDLDPEYHAAYGLLGDAAVELGDEAAAFTHYQKMQDIRPDLASYSRGAHLLYLTGDARRATWMMQKAIDAGAVHAENLAWSKAELALMYWGIGAFLPAEQILEEALGAHPANYHLLAAMGKEKTALNDYDAAIVHYREAIAIAPQHDAVVALGDVYALTGRTAESERHYELVEAIHDINRKHGVRGALELARFYADRDRNLDEALAIAEAEYRDRPNARAADTLAWCYYKVGRYQDARKMSEKALSLRPADAGVLFHAGMIDAKLGDRVRAQQLLYRALSVNPSFHPLHAAAAVDALAQLGTREPAPPPAGPG
jgi:tetratricopeptide (TPR) repeat protein